MKIWNVPIESLEERYSADWNRWFPTEFQKAGVEYETIYGEELTNKIEQGAFLDVIGTNYFKASQIQIICQKIYSGQVKDGDVFLFHDFWFPGVETLAYIRDSLSIDFKIVGLLHAGTWDEHDFLSHKGMTSWAEDLEESWFQLADCLFVATEFHKNLIENKRKVGCPIYVTGFPIYDEHSDPNVKKERIIVFPHRLDSEKQPEEFDRLQATFRENFPEYNDWQFIKSKDVTSNKQEYYDLLNKSSIAVSTALQETWGIAMQEALFAGCVPFVPSRLSYREMYTYRLRYNVLGGLAIQLGQEVIPNLSQFQKIAGEQKEEILTYSKKAIPNMIKIIKELE